MKTLDDYRNDPDIVKMKEPWREVHAIRLMLRDETKDMTDAECVKYYEDGTARFFASMGKPVPYARVGSDGCVL